MGNFLLIVLGFLLFATNPEQAEFVLTQRFLHRLGC